MSGRDGAGDGRGRRERSDSPSIPERGRGRRTDWRESRGHSRERDGGRRSQHEQSRSRSPVPRRGGKEAERHRKRSRRQRSHSQSPMSSRSPTPDDRGERRRSRRREGRKGDDRAKGHRKRSASGDQSRSRSASSSRSSSPDDRAEERRRRRRIEEKDREKKRKQKDVMKALETPEEKRARRVGKKEAKERTRREKMGWDKEYLGYTNADNPFGDQHLLDKFVWSKKRKQEAEEMQLSRKEVERREKLRQDEMRRELEKVKKRRIEREKEREAREDEMVLLARMKEADMFKEWESQEDQFHLEQAKLRSKIRIESGRAKPIDLLAKYINMTEEDMDIEVQEPYHLLKGLNVVDLEDLLDDIAVYCELEEDTHLEYWKDMTTICVDEGQKLRKLEQADSGGGGADWRGGINSAVSADVSTIFKGKTHGQLQALEKQINDKITAGGGGTDVGYWESLLQQLKAHMARARLRDRHQAMLRKKLFKLKQEQAEEFGVVGTPLFPSAGPSGQREEAGEGEGEREGEGEGEGEEEEESVVQAVKMEEGAEQEEVEEKKEEKEEEVKAKPNPGPSTVADESETLIDEEDLLQQAYDDYESGRYSPKLLKTSEVSEEHPMFSPKEDERLREAARAATTSGAAKPSDPAVSEYKELEMTRSVDSEGVASEEYNFNSEVVLEAQNPIWREKYRPRKPRFFNRVHTGFEWNKYNQTHYDTDNPPPKIVQGYKFNIFFPDLIEKRKTPTYSLTPCKDDDEFTILRFRAGPPYEDIGFKIVNREWEYSWKHGFKSQFNNNILQLWFRFKRNRYRR